MTTTRSPNVTFLGVPSLSQAPPFCQAQPMVSFQLDPHAQARFNEGRIQLEKLATDPLSHGCWSEVVAELEAGCRSMDDQLRSWLAVQFANCHLQKSGLPTYECSRNMTTASCTQPMVDSVNSIAYSVYTTFYTHAESMCFFLQSEAFERATERAVDQLHLSSVDAAKRMAALGEHAASLVEHTSTIRAEQLRAVDAARSLLQEQQQASTELASLQAQQAAAFVTAEAALAGLHEQSAEALRGLQADAQVIGAKQRAAEAVLDRVIDLQQLLLGEVGDVVTVCLYAGAFVILLLLTTAPSPMRTARIPALLCLLATAVAEKTVARLLSADYLGADETTSWCWRRRLRRFGVAFGAYLLLRAIFCVGAATHRRRRVVTRLIARRATPTSTARRLAKAERAVSSAAAPVTAQAERPAGLDSAEECAGAKRYREWQAAEATQAALIKFAERREEEQEQEEEEKEEEEKEEEEEEAEEEKEEEEEEAEEEKEELRAEDEVEEETKKEEEDSAAKARAIPSEPAVQHENSVSPSASLIPHSQPEVAVSRSRRTPDGGAAAGIAAGLSPGAYLTKRGRLSIKPIAFHANAYIPRQSDGSYFRGADGQVQLECAGVGVDFTAKFTGKDANCARNRSSSASGRSRKAADAKASGSAKTLRSGSGTQSESENRARSRLAVGNTV